MVATVGSGSQGETTGGLPCRNNVILERILADKKGGKFRHLGPDMKDTVNSFLGLLERCGATLFLFCVIHKCLQIVATPDERDHKETSICDLGTNGNKNACVWAGQLTGKAGEHSRENSEQSSTVKTLDVS